MLRTKRLQPEVLLRTDSQKVRRWQPLNSLLLLWLRSQHLQPHQKDIQNWQWRVHKQHWPQQTDGFSHDGRDQLYDIIDKSRQKWFFLLLHSWWKIYVEDHILSVVQISTHYSWRLLLLHQEESWYPDYEVLWPTQADLEKQFWSIDREELLCHHGQCVQHEIENYIEIWY